MSTYSSTIDVNASTSIISGISCIFMISSYFLCKQLRTYEYKMIVIQAVFDIGRSFANLLPTYNFSSDTFICQFQGICIQIFTTTSVAWSAMMTHAMYMYIVKSIVDAEIYNKKYFLITITLSLVTTLPPVITNDYGRTVSWCWIEESEYGFIWVLLFTHCMFFIVQIFNFVLCVIIIVKLKSNKTAMLEKSDQQSIVNRIFWYPIILAVCFWPMSSYRIYQFFSSDNSYLYVNIGTFFMNLNGFCNAVKYGTTDTVIKSFKGIFDKKRKKSEHLETISMERQKSTINAPLILGAMLPNSSNCSAISKA